MTFIIDGNIGSGKSTLLKKIKELHPEKEIILENIHVFKTWLDLFYQDMEKYSLGFQMEVLMSHMKHKKHPNFGDNKLIIERSPLSCLHVFGLNLVESGNLSKEENNLCMRINMEFGWLPKKIIYIETDPKICFGRIQERNREGESSISLDYLQKIHVLYQKIYQNSKQLKVFIIDGNQSADKVYQEVLEIIR
jgi:deoxyadenosine/deoxycytidine kinase